MQPEAAILFVLLNHMPTHKADRAEPDRTARLANLAAGMRAAADHATCQGEYAVAGCKKIAGDWYQVVGRLISLGRHESDFRYDIQLGHCSRWECDARKVKGQIVHYARGPWQAHRMDSMTEAEWDGLLGTDAATVERTAWLTTWLLYGYEKLNHQGGVGAVAGYATGKVGRPYDDAAMINARAERYRVLLRQVAANPEPGV